MVVRKGETKRHAPTKGLLTRTSHRAEDPTPTPEAASAMSSNSLKSKKSHSIEHRLMDLTLFVIMGMIVLLGFQQYQLAHQMDREDIMAPDGAQLLESPMAAKRLMRNATLSSLSVRGGWRKEGTLKYLLYLTTVFSDEHQQYFRHCWPSLLSRSKLLQGADVLIFSNNQTEVDGSIIAFVHELFANNPSFGIRFLSPSAVLEISKPSNRGAWLLDTYENVFQLGANEAVRLGFSEGWFSPYDWVIRINPDVLIRRSKWLLETMKDPSVDGIFVECSKEPWRIHTDFFVVRPSACRPDAFSDLVEDVFDGQGNHEMTAAKEFRPIIEADRHRWLPDNDDSQTICRVRGSKSTVAHNHDAVRQSAHGQLVCVLLDDFETD